MTKFVDDVPRTSGKAKLSAVLTFARSLRENPGCWAKYPLDIGPASAREYARNIRGGRGHRALQVFRTGDFDAEYREGCLYVRFAGRVE